MGRRGAALFRLIRWLALAATPTFALMALWTTFFPGHTDMFCTATRGPSPMGGMTMMYLLMALFHVSPWLKLIFGSPNRAR